MAATAQRSLPGVNGVALINDYILSALVYCTLSRDTPCAMDEDFSDHESDDSVIVVSVSSATKK